MKHFDNLSEAKCIIVPMAYTSITIQNIDKYILKESVCKKKENIRRKKCKNFEKYV